jgi:hypothetical protein
LSSSLFTNKIFAICLIFLSKEKIIGIRHKVLKKKRQKQRKRQQKIWSFLVWRKIPTIHSRISGLVNRTE